MDRDGEGGADEFLRAVAGHPGVVAVDVGVVTGEVQPRDARHGVRQGDVLLAKLLFRQLALGDVLGDAGDTIDGAGFIADGERPVAQPADGAVGPHDAILDIVFLRDGLAEGGFEDVVAVIRMNEVRPRIRLLINFIDGAAADRFKPRAEVEHLLVVSGAHPEDFRDVAGELAKSFFTFTQGFVSREERPGAGFDAALEFAVGRFQCVARRRQVAGAPAQAGVKDSKRQESDGVQGERDGDDDEHPLRRPRRGGEDFNVRSGAQENGRLIRFVCRRIIGQQDAGQSHRSAGNHHGISGILHS